MKRNGENYLKFVYSKGDFQRFGCMLTISMGFMSGVPFLKDDCEIVTMVEGKLNVCILGVRRRKCSIHQRGGENYF